MHTITSLTLNFALKKPGMAPQSTPSTVPVSSASVHMIHAGMLPCGMLSATSRLPMAPIRYCPGAPILNRPVLKARETERPVMMSGVAVNSMLPQVKSTSLALPAAPGPESTMKMPLKASDTGISLEQIAITSSTMKPTSRPPRIQMRDAMTDCTAGLRRKGTFSVVFAVLRIFSASFRVRLPFGARHIQAELLYGGGFGIELAHDLALVHHQDAVREVHDLVQLQ